MKKFIVLFNLFSSMVLAAPVTKKTVCSITINSNNEIELFKKHLSKSLWNFKELTEFAKGNQTGEQWFKSACKEKINCDILVISGHFGGTFFGESGLSLAVEDLEKSTCDTDCSGIINKPKEVFLFGCNTLAGKEQDSRTPEQYMQVLLEDGFSREQAQQVVAFRYSELGNTFKGRMSQIFTNTPRIYGFTSIGPSGATVEPLLKNYLLQSKENYLNFDLYNKTLTTKTNQKFITALKDTPVAQVSGLSVFDSSYMKSERPYCYLANEKVKVIDKLSYIKSTLIEGRGLTILNYVKDYLSELKNKNYNFSNEENALLNDLKNNDKINQDFNKLLSLKGDVYLKTRVDVLGLMKDLQIINVADYTQGTLKILDLDLKVKLSLEKKDRICSTGAHVDIDPKNISEINQNNIIFIQMLECLKPQNVELHEFLVNILKSNKAQELRITAAQALGSAKVQNQTIVKKIIDTMLNDSSEHVRSAAQDALSVIESHDPAIAKIFMSLMQTHPNSQIRRDATLMYVGIKPQDPVIIEAIAATLKNDLKYEVRLAAIIALANIKSPNPVAIKSLIDAVKNEKESRARSSAIYALSEALPQDAKINQLLSNLIKNETDEEVVSEAIGALHKINPRDPLTTQLLVSVFRKYYDGGEISESIVCAASGVLSQREIKDAALNKKIQHSYEGCRAGLD